MEYISPEPLVYAVPALDVEHFSTAPKVLYAVPAPKVYAEPASVVECISTAPAVSSCRGLHISSSCSVCRKRSCGGVHRSCARASNTAREHTAFTVLASVGDCFSPAPEVSYAAPAFVVEYISCASIMEYIEPATVGNAGQSFISTTRLLEEENYAALTIQQGWRWTRKRIVIRVTSGQGTHCGAFAGGSQRQEKDREPQGHAIDPEGC